MKLGLIGVGGMGRPMGEHLLAAGHELMVWSRRPDAADPLLALGARRAASPLDLAECCEMVCTNVTGSVDVIGLARPPSRAKSQHVTRRAAAILSMHRYPAVRPGRRPRRCPSCGAETLL